MQEAKVVQEGWRWGGKRDGGEGGIRTHGPPKRSPDFESPGDRAGPSGKRRYGSEHHPTRKKAERALREKLAQRDRGYAIPSPSRIPKVRDYVETWKQGEAAAKLRPRTLRDYLEQIERHVLPKIGDRRLDAVHSALLEQEVVAPLRQRGLRRTARFAVSALSSVYRSAVKDPTLGLVGNPCHGVEVGQGPRRAIQPMDAEERSAFREAIRGTEHETLWLLMMQTGLGPGEALALGWEHLDLGAGEARVARTLDCQARELVDDAKRPSRLRLVPLPPDVRNALRERWLTLGRPGEGLVFATWDERPLSLAAIRKDHFKPALKRAGITRRLRIYDLRHGFATAALEAGADTKTVSELLGHGSTAMVQNVYQHVSDERKRATAAQVWERLGDEGVSR